MFNLTGSEIMFLLIIGLVVLGPEKLPDAIRRVGRLYAELKRMSSGVQTDLRKVMDEPLKEMMNTTNSMKALFSETAGQFQSAAKDAVDLNFVEYQSPTAVGLSKSSESLTQYELTKDEDDEEVAAPPIRTEEENQTEVTPASLNPLDDIS